MDLDSEPALALALQLSVRDFDSESHLAFAVLLEADEALLASEPAHRAPSFLAWHASQPQIPFGEVSESHGSFCSEFHCAQSARTNPP